MAVFGIDSARPDELVALSLSELDGRLQVKRRGTVDKGITEGFDGLSDAGITCHPAQLDEGLAFEGSRLSTIAIVLPEGIKTGRQRALRAKGTQAQVDLKGSRAPYHNEIEELLDEHLGILTDGDLVRPTGVALAAIDAEDFKVRGISQLTATELAEAKEGKGTGAAIGAQRTAIALLQRLMGQRERCRQDHLCQVGQFIRKHAKG